MADLILDIFRDMPVVDYPSRPEGMLGYMRSEVPDEYRPMVDEWVRDKGGEVITVPLIEVHGGTSPQAGPEADGYYALPPVALVVQ